MEGRLYGALPSACALVATSTVGICGNAAMVVATVRSKSLHNPCNILIAVCCAADGIHQAGKRSTEGSVGTVPVCLPRPEWKKCLASFDVCLCTDPAAIGGPLWQLHTALNWNGSSSHGRDTIVVIFCSKFENASYHGLPKTVYLAVQLVFPTAFCVYFILEVYKSIIPDK